MARGVTVKVEGLKDLEKALEQFKPATSKAIARRWPDRVGARVA